MLTRDDSVRGVLVRGIDPALEPRVSELAAQVVRGKLEALAPGEFGVAIGGVLTVAVVVAAALLFPSLRRMDRFPAPHGDE